MFARHARSLGPAPELVLLAAAAWFLAAIASTLAGAVLRPGLAVPVARATAPTPRAFVQPALHADRLERLLGVAPAPAPEAIAGAARDTARCDDRDAPPVRAASGLALVGGVLADPPERSLASVADAATRETYLLAVGERRAGLRLLEVLPVRRAGDVAENARELVAVICNDGRKEYVAAAAAGDAPAPDALPRAAPPGVIAPARALGRDRYAIERSALDAALTNPTILSDARVVPALEGGVARGFKVLSIRPGSFLASLGLEHGDVIRTVNGYELTTVERALELHGRLREASRVTLELERGGRTIHREYEIGAR